MNALTRELVRERAKYRCEYCHLPEAATPFLAFHLEHIIAQQHLGDSTLENLALACDRCNAFKGPNLAGIDPLAFSFKTRHSARFFARPFFSGLLP